MQSVPVTPQPYTGAKRGRKPGRGRGGAPISPHITSFESPVQDTTAKFTQVRWATPSISTPVTAYGGIQATTPAIMAGQQQHVASSSALAAQAYRPLAAGTTSYQSSTLPVSSLDSTGLLRFSTTATTSMLQSLPGVTRVATADDEGEGDDDLLPAMADDDYSAHSNWNTQSKDNLKVLMDNFSPEQYDRFEAYRRHALPKQAVRKLIQQTLGQQVSQPVAQIVAGFSKVFVGEIVEKARKVQARRGEVGPLAPDHLREAYRMYQQETGRVGAARPLRAKRLFVR